MAYAFAIGTIIGLPFGCFIREKAYSSKAYKAIEAMRSPAGGEFEEHDEQKKEYYR